MLRVPRFGVGSITSRWPDSRERRKSSLVLGGLVITVFVWYICFQNYERFMKPFSFPCILPFVQRGGAYALLIGGWSVAAYLIQWTWSNLKDLLVNHNQWVIGYLVVVGECDYILITLLTDTLLQGSYSLPILFFNNSLQELFKAFFRTPVDFPDYKCTSTLYSRFHGTGKKKSWPKFQAKQWKIKMK